MRISRQRGFGYFGVLLLIALLGIASAASVQVGVVIDRRDRELELLAIGGEFRAAIRSFHAMTPAGQRRYPATLEDLLKDPRHPGVVRHLRRIYVDPLTGKAEWGTVAAPEGGILGVYSRADGVPIKLAFFDAADAEFEGRTKYSEWVFAYVPEDRAPPPAR